jgi:stage II sporulation protein D
MSQWGAHQMASEGKAYREILMHYYTGVSIVQMAEVLGA